MNAPLPFHPWRQAGFGTARRISNRQCIQKVSIAGHVHSPPILAPVTVWRGPGVGHQFWSRAGSEDWKGGPAGEPQAMMHMYKNLDIPEEMGCPENVVVVPPQKPRRKSWKDGVPMRQADPPRRLPVGTRHSAHRAPDFGTARPQCQARERRVSHLIVASHQHFPISNHQRIIFNHTPPLP